MKRIMSVLMFLLLILGTCNIYENQGIYAKQIPSQYNLNINSYKQLTYEEAIALIVYNIGYNNSAGKYKNIVVKDKKGNKASTWSAPYIALAQTFKGPYGSIMPEVPSFKEKATKFWVVKFLINLRGYNKYIFYKPLIFKDTSGMSMSDQMFLNTGITFGIGVSEKNGYYNPNRAITKTDIKNMLKMADKNRMRVIAKNFNSLPTKNIPSKSKKIIQQYFTNDSNQTIEYQYNLLKKYKNSINQVIFNYANVYTTSDDKTSEGRNYKIGAFNGKNFYVSTWAQEKRLKQILKETNGSKYKRYFMLSDDFSKDVDGEVEGLVFRSKETRNNLINLFCSLIKEFNIEGINLDIEHMSPKYKNDYVVFVKELSNKMHSMKKSLTISLPALADPENYETGIAYDYKALGKLADYVAIRLYGEYKKNGPIASAQWEDKVLKYCTLAIPSEKLLLGIASYGFNYDYNNDSVDVVGVRDLLKIKTEYAKNGTYEHNYVKSLESPNITYVDKFTGHKRIIWFEDKNSLKFKNKILNKYSLVGLSIWHLGYENDEFIKDIINFN